MASSAPLVRAALFDALTATTGMCRVFYGHPGPNLPDDFVSVMPPQTDEGYGPMGTARSSEETITVGVVFSCYGGDSQQTVTERAYTYADLLRAHLKTTPALGLSQPQCRNATVADSQLLETDSAEDATTGRYAELALLIRTNARLT